MPCLLILLLCLQSSIALGDDDWCQWGGSNRLFVNDTTRLLDDSQLNDLEELWRIPIGSGHSGIVTKDDVGFTAFTRGNQEHIVAFSLSSGDQIWERRFGVEPCEFMDLEFGLGPHATPLIADNVLICVGLTGRISALKTSDGSTSWEKQLWTGEAFTKLERGFASSPIRFRDSVIVSNGGSGTALQCFSLKDGKTRWSRHGFVAAYASPVIKRLCNQIQFVQLMDQNLVGLDPENGALLWQHPVPTERYVNCTSPVTGPDDMIFINTGEGLRGLKVTCNRDKYKVNEIWASRITICQTTNFVLEKGILYGSKEGNVFAAVEAKSGKTMWQSRALKDSCIVSSNGRILAVQENGTVVVVGVSREGIEKVWKADVLESRCWIAPVLTEHYILVRDAEKLIKFGLRTNPQSQALRKNLDESESIEQLDRLIREKHVRPFWRQNQNDYEAVFRKAKFSLANKDLTDEQRNVELLKVLAAVGDGHTGMAASSRDKLFGYIPITAAWFGEVLRIVRTTAENKETLGAKIVSVEGTKLAELKQKLMSVVPHANSERFKKLSPSYLQLPGLLKGLGIANSKDQTKFKLQLISGETKDVVFKRMNDQQYEKAAFVTFDQFATSLPLCRQRSDEDFWYEYLPREKTLYFKYNRISAGDEQSIWTWAPAMWSKVDSLDIEKLVIDIRDNGGGGFQYSLPIIQGILDRPDLNQRGKLFVLTGYKTFSAAIGFLEQIEARTQAIIVGEPPCDYPASPGDAEKFPLGDTGIEVYLSQIFHSTLFPDDGRKSIGLDKQIITTWDDYAAGKDPLLTYVKDYQPEETKPTPENAFARIGRYTYSADKVLTLSKLEGELRLEIGKFFSTPLFPKMNGRYKTEIVGLEVELSDKDQIQLFFPDGKKQTFTLSKPDHVTPLELIYAGRFGEAKEGFKLLLNSNPNSEVVTDSELADTALLLYWDLVKEKGRTEARKYARKTLEIAIELFDEAPISEFSLRFYR